MINDPFGWTNPPALKCLLFFKPTAILLFNKRRIIEGSIQFSQGLEKYENLFLYKFKKLIRNNSERNNFGSSLTDNSKIDFHTTATFSFYDPSDFKNTLFSKVRVKKTTKTIKHPLTTLKTKL